MGLKNQTNLLDDAANSEILNVGNLIKLYRECLDEDRAFVFKRRSQTF